MNHTGNELQLMLAGKKPLAMFYCGTLNGVSYEEMPEKEFDVHVDSGEFVKGELNFNLKSGVSIRYVMYALKTEQWRISALKVVLREMIRMERSDEGIDRITGALLGYSDEEIDEYVRCSPHYSAANSTTR